MAKAAVVLAVLTGMLLGVGAFTFDYAAGFSYFSNEPEACVNCHIMNDHFDSWVKSSHHAHAVCNDCHTPHALVAKYVSKAENGFNHSLKFTLGTYREPIRIRPVNAARLQANCIECHQELVSEIRWEANLAHEDLDCVRCHAAVGHGPRR